MGWGTCTAPANGSPVGRRRHCGGFHWDAAAAVAKALCLATFFVVETPRRAVAVARGGAYPPPIVNCSGWTVRQCACGHNFYDHTADGGGGADGERV